MSFYFSKCPLCESEVELDEEQTIKSYIEKDFSISNDFILVGENPPTTPDYLVVSCVNPNCSYTERRTILSLLEDLRDGWLRVAWLIKQKEADGVFRIRDELVEKFKSLPKDQLKKLEAVDNNAMMRSILKQIENEKS